MCFPPRGWVMRSNPTGRGHGETGAHTPDIRLTGPRESRPSEGGWVLAGQRRVTKAPAVEMLAEAPSGIGISIAEVVALLPRRPLPFQGPGDVHTCGQWGHARRRESWKRGGGHHVRTAEALGDPLQAQGGVTKGTPATAESTAPATPWAPPKDSWRGGGKRRDASGKCGLLSPHVISGMVLFHRNANADWTEHALLRREPVEAAQRKVRVECQSKKKTICLSDQVTVS